MSIDAAPEIPKEQRKISRREFLKLAGATGSGILLGRALGESSITKTALKAIFTPPKERAELLKNEIEQFYNIDVVEPQELQTVNVFGTPLSTIEWKEADLKILSHTLKDLPPHFYLPVYGNKLLFTIVDPDAIPGEYPGDGSFSNLCDCLAEVDPHIIALDRGWMELAGYELLRATISHELTHRVFGFRSDSVIDEPDGRSRLANVDIWNTDLERVGRELDWLYKNDQQKMFENSNFRSVLRYGVQNWHEFVATAGETFILGRNHFVNSYGEYFGAEKAGKLYDFMKEEIFRGKEY